VEETRIQIKGFEDIIAWQKARDLVIELYRLMNLLKDYSFKDQLWRAAISIMNNIAEGYERGTNAELKHFLYISKGSCGEVHSMVCLGKSLKYFNQEDSLDIENKAIEISKILSGFIKKL
jgi:four helix bundle protein